MPYPKSCFAIGIEYRWMEYYAVLCSIRSFKASNRHFYAFLFVWHKNALAIVGICGNVHVRRLVFVGIQLGYPI